MAGNQNDSDYASSQSASGVTTGTTTSSGTNNTFLKTVSGVVQSSVVKLI